MPPDDLNQKIQRGHLLKSAEQAFVEASCYDFLLPYSANGELAAVLNATCARRKFEQRRRACVNLRPELTLQQGVNKALPRH